MDRIECLIQQIRQDLSKYPYQAKYDLNHYSLDNIFTVFEKRIKECEGPPWYDTAKDIGYICDEIMAMLDEKSDIVSGEKIRAITVKISVQSGYQNDRFHELMEESNRIRDTKRRCSILEELRKIDDMRAGFYKDLETIHKSLESKARFGREDVDLGELAAELYEKYSYSRRRLDKGSGSSA